MMKSTLSVGLLATLLAGVSIASQESTRAMPDVRLMTVATGHFHATQHPIIQSFEPGEDWRWCYVDQMVV